MSAAIFRETRRGVRVADQLRIVATIDAFGVRHDTPLTRRTMASSNGLTPGRLPCIDCAAIFCETFWDVQVPKRSKKLAALLCLRRPVFALRTPRRATYAACHGSHNGLTPGSVALHVLSACALAQTPTTRPALPPT